MREGELCRIANRLCPWNQVLPFGERRLNLRLEDNGSWPGGPKMKAGRGGMGMEETWPFVALRSEV